jgi:acetyl esterase
VPLDPQARRLLDVLGSLGTLEVDIPTPAVARAGMAAQCAKLPRGPDADVANRVLPDASGAIGVRVYRPLGSEKQVLPVVVHFHGGGFAVGDVDQSDGDCRHMAVGVPCAVVSVEYPLAPEHKFPRGLETCYAATKWVYEHADEFAVDPSKIAIAGDSAGGNLAAGVAIMARDRGGPPIAYQVLVYPITDLSNFDTPSYLQNGEGLYLTRAAMQWFAGLYLRDEAEALNGFVSPLRMPDLSGLPPGLVITAEFDPLRDEGEAYARRLQDAGVLIKLSRYDGMIHGFFTMSPYLDAGKQATDEVVRELRSAFYHG